MSFLKGLAILLPTLLLKKAEGTLMKYTGLSHKVALFFFIGFLHRIKQSGKDSPIKHSDVTVVLLLFLFIWETISLENLDF